MKKETFGYLRETSELAKKAGINKSTGLHRTGLDEYLSIIFPKVTDWVHDKPIGKLSNGKICRKRPNYRSETLKLIVELDGIQHYQSPEQIIKDYDNTELYKSLGYTVVRIPYFIQLTNDAVEQLFNKKVRRKLFNVKYPSLDETCGPAKLCPAGINRMAYEFLQFPDQLEVNLNNLWDIDNDFLTGASLLDKEIDTLINEHRVDYNYLFTQIFNDILQEIYQNAFDSYIAGKHELLEGNFTFESLLPSHKDFYETFIMDKLNEYQLEDKVIDLLYESFMNKLIHYFEIDDDLN